MHVSNQMPQSLTWQHKETSAGDFDPIAILDEIITNPLMTPYIQGQPVQFTDDSNQPMDKDAVRAAILDTCGNTVDPSAEDFAKDMYSQTLIRYQQNTALSAQEVFATQAGIAAKLPEPGPRCQYTPQTDIKPVCMEFLANQCDADKLFATFAFYARPHTLGFYFANEQVFEDFKAHLNAQAQLVASMTTGAVNQKMSQFQQMRLDELTQSIVIRTDDSDDNQEFSFSRQLTSALMSFATAANTPQELFGCFPFALGELVCPRTIVFVNIERHARATPRAIEDEWTLIKQSLTQQVTLISNNQLRQLTAGARAHKRIASQMNMLSQLNQRGRAMRSISTAFASSAPSRRRVVTLLKKVLNKMEAVSRSQNVFKQVKSSFARPNRRDPDNFNLKGKVVSTQYMPDIHIYLDTSGSISEENYKDAIETCIALAQKLEVNLYFNSFSHIMSQTTLLRTKNATRIEAYKQFQRVPKVGGGTDYEQIWNFIGASNRRKRELSLIITDFEYYPPNHYVEHPKNLYYIPCANMDWQDITRWAKNFCRAMAPIDPTIRKKLLM